MMKSRCKFLILLTFVISSFLFIDSAKADSSYAATVLNPIDASCNLRNGSTGYCYYSNKNLNSLTGVLWLDTGDKVTVYPDNKVETNNSDLCSDYYVYVDFYYPKKSTTYHGYYCHANLTNSALTDELKNEFKTSGFPESYWKDLAVLKTAHPNWTFKAINTGLNWNDVIKVESAVGTSLIEGNEEGYRSTLGGSYDYYTDKFKVLEGSNWYAANSQVVEYYMDPRTF